jgi:putative CocE/NonD family hydrolase
MGKDTRKLEHREDILVYTSEAFEADMEITGLVKAVLYISSSAPDTDFMVKILDVYPDGRAIALSDGAARARYRNSWAPELLEPGKVYEIDVNAGYISYQFAKGHFIRIEVTSSNFMKFDYNHNTGLRPGDDPGIQPAINTVHHCPDAPSRILLPFVSGKNNHEV